MIVHEAGAQPPSPEPCKRCRRMRRALVMRMMESADEPTRRAPWKCPACRRLWAIVPSEDK